jgi:hypothetical protein
MTKEQNPQHNFFPTASRTTFGLWNNINFTLRDSSSEIKVATSQGCPLTFIREIRNAWS